MKIIILIYISFLVSCGTMRGSHNIVAVDSFPRGAKVFNEKGKEIGVTPFLYERDEGRKSEYQFKLNNQKNQFVHHRCNINWSRSILPNFAPLVFGLPGLAVSGGLITTDHFTGGLYECKAPIFTYFQGEKESKKVTKKKVLVLPAFSDNLLDAQSVMAKWLSNWKKEKHTDIEILDVENSSELLYENGINYQTTFKLDKIKKNSLYKVAHELKATHVIYFSHNKSKDAISYVPELYDVFSLTKEKEQEKIIIEKYKGKYGFWNYIKQATNFFPNALTLNLSVSQTSSYYRENQLRDDLTVERHPDAFPKYVTLFGLQRVQHPQFYNDWDYDFEFYPELGGSSWRKRLTLNSAEYISDVLIYYLVYNAGITFHTPYGALSFALGIGWSYNKFEDSLNYEESGVEILNKFTISHTVFFHHKYYVRISGEIYSPNDLGNVDGYTVKDFASGVFSVGYYFPTMGKSFLNLFKKKKTTH